MSNPWSGYTITMASPPPPLYHYDLANHSGHFASDHFAYQETCDYFTYDEMAWGFLLGYMGFIGTFCILNETYRLFRSWFSFRRSGFSSGRSTKPSSEAILKPRKSRAVSKKRLRSTKGRPQRSLKKRRRSSCPSKFVMPSFRPYDLVYVPGLRAEVSSSSSILPKDSSHRPLRNLDDGSSEAPRPSSVGPLMLLSFDHLYKLEGLTHALVGKVFRQAFFDLYFPHHSYEWTEGLDPKLLYFHWTTPQALRKAKSLLRHRLALSPSLLVEAKEHLSEVPVPLLTWDPFKDRIWYIREPAVREEMVKRLIERSLWPSHVRISLDPSDPYDLGFFPGEMMEDYVSSQTYEKLLYEAGGRKMVTVLRPHRFPSLMVYYF